MNLFSKYFIWIFVLSTLNLNAQEDNFVVPGSLKNKSFDELSSIYYNSKPSISNDSIIANTYFVKAVKERDTVNIATAYCFFTSTTNNIKLKEKYIDEAIQLTKEKLSYSFPCLLYSLKAGIYEEKKDFKTALDYYILAHDSALKVENSSIVSIMKYNIGVLKLNIGMYKEALAYGRESWKDMKKDSLSDLYLNSLFLISSAYTNNSKIDSASIFNSLGISKSLQYKNKTHFSRFTLLEGVNQYKKKNYNICIDSLKKSLPQLIADKDLENTSISYYFLGKSYSNLKNFKKSIIYFKKMDSIFSSNKILVPYCRDGYKEMIGYYRSIGDSENQLIYTLKLVNIDSVLDNNYQYLISNIYEKFEKPKLIAEKQILINSLKKDNSSFSNYLTYSFIVILLIGLGFILTIYKKRKDYKKFSKIISQLDNEIAENKSNIKKNIKEEVSIEIDESIIQNTLIKLDKFEKGQGFLNKKVTLQFLAKKVGTNTKYLSKIINTYKQKNFSNYLNDLRINYVIERLHSDEQFRKYTIEAIADESGFKNNRSFFGVFHKKTGISPSYFIEQLKTRINN